MYLYKYVSFLEFFYAVVKMYCFIYVKQNKVYVPAKNNVNIKQKKLTIYRVKKNIMHSTSQYEQLRHNCTSLVRTGLAYKLANTDILININLIDINLLFCDKYYVKNILYFFVRICELADLKYNVLKQNVEYIQEKLSISS